VKHLIVLILLFVATRGWCAAPLLRNYFTTNNVPPSLIPFTITPEQFGGSPFIVDNQPAFQAMFNAASRNLTTGSNLVINIGPGNYNLSSSILITNCRSIRVVGSGKNNTILTANFAGPVIRTDGMWFSYWQDIQFVGTVGHAGGIFELDGNRAHDSVNFGVQGNTFKDCYFYGNNVVGYGLSVTPVGSSFGQGSENLFLNCHFLSCTNAGYRQTGYNALQNTFIGGNVQDCRLYGIKNEFGSLNIYSMGFQNGFQTQLGYDVFSTGAGQQREVVEGCRTESLRGVFSDGNTAVRDWFHAATPLVWQALTAYSVSNIVQPTVPNGYAYRCTTNGTSGGSQPNWVAFGFEVNGVNDGSVHWAVVNERIMDVRSLSGSTVPYGKVNAVTLTGNRFSRPNFWDFDIAYTPYGTAFANEVFTNLVNGQISYSYGYPTDAGRIVNLTPFEMGNSVFVWTRGDAGDRFRDVGIGRNDGSNQVLTGTPDYSHNVVGVIGSLGKLKSVTVGETFRLVGGIGTITNGGGPIEFWTQTLGSDNATLRASISTNGNFVLSGTTNQIIFGATNVPPASSASPTKWISIQVTGDSTQYRLPLYQ